MKIVSSYGKRVFFRFFNENDTVYAVGFDEGTIDRGEEVEYLVPGFGRFKVEFKEYGLAGSFLMKAGIVYTNGDMLWVTKDGKVIPVGVLEQSR